MNGKQWLPVRWEKYFQNSQVSSPVYESAKKQKPFQINHSQVIIAALLLIYSIIVIVENSQTAWLKLPFV